MSTEFRLPLKGAGGEPVDLWRTFVSHGVASLPPMRVDEVARTFEVTLALPRGKPRRIVVSESKSSREAIVKVHGPRLSDSAREALTERLRHVLRMDEDLSGLYKLCATDESLAWACTGAGRMIRSATVFEETVKTICTTNCTWSATERMVGALVEHLGEPAAGAPPDGPWGRAFPTPEAMAKASTRFYKDKVRAGYRGAYLRSLAQGVVTGAIELEDLGTASPDEVSDQEVAERLLALPGVGPYAAAHIMMMLGRYSRLILDSWTRPKYARLAGKKSASDTAIERRFRKFGRYAGLAFWLFVTSDWVLEEEPQT